MKLQSLELSGFKSFAKKGILSFDSSISAIVGPNGSGKSNVAEAFRFVLGEQSIKNMRGKRGEDLIFNGTDGNSRMNKASVKITFDNSDRKISIDFDQVTIERVVHRDGVNEYFLNGSQVRLRDISELLAEANIGSTGHHIISQGEADRVLNSSLKDRKSMLEDALGLKVFQYKKKESERKLEKTRENINQVQSLRKEIAPHIRFLKRQVEKIEKTKELQSDLTKKYQEYFKRETEYLKNEESEIKREQEEPVEKLQKVQSSIKNLRIEIESNKSKGNESSELLGFESEYTEIRKEKDIYLRSLGSLEGEIRTLIRLLEEEQNRQEEDITISHSVFVRFTKEGKRLLALISNARSIDDAKDFLEELSDTLDVFESEFISSKPTNDRLIALESQIKEMKGEKDTLEKSLLDTEEKERLLQSKIALVKNSIEESKTGTLEAEKKVLELMAEESNIQNVLHYLQDRQSNLIRAKGDLEQELREARVLIGPSVFDFDSAVSVETGKLLTNDLILSEDRSKQLERKRIIERQKVRLEDAGITGSEDVLKEYNETSERDEFLIKEIEDLETSSASLEELINNLSEEISVKFNDGIKKINKEFTEFFSLMFGGGHASLSVVKAPTRKKKKDEELDLTDEVPEEEEAEDGVDIKIDLPRKRVKDMMMLSGGERALTSIALLFAMSAVNPPPFIILDETDAALDEANSRKYGDMIVNLSKHSQLILITHNRETMSRAGVMYGITMQSGITQTLSIKFEEGLQYAK